MATDKELVTVREASDILNYSISLPEKKCITFGELTQIIDEMPKANGVIDGDYNDIQKAIISKDNYNFCLVQNLNRDSAKLSSSYGDITITSDNPGGYFCIPNASEYDKVKILKNRSALPIAYRYAPSVEGSFTRKKVNDIFNVLTEPGYSYSWEVRFNENYDMSGFGYFYFIII